MTIHYIIYRKNISLKSGTGQLISMQAENLKVNGDRFTIYCQSGAFGFLIKNKILARKSKIEDERLTLGRDENNFIIDHDASLKNAHVTFIHNIPAENSQNKSYFDWLKKSACSIISNSIFTKKELLRQGFNESNISVVYPGYNPKFCLSTRDKYRDNVRKKLSLTSNTKLIGFITSGDFDKRGLDHFIEICEEMSFFKNVKFFIMGSKKLPKKYLNHPIVQSKNFIYKPKSSTPEYWLSAIDIFVYPARFEEFGMVIPEALSMGIPVITTRNVGASEILPDQYQEWISDTIDVAWFVERISTLLKNNDKYNHLCSLSLQSLEYNDKDYATRTMNAIKDISLKTPYKK